jgi:hypothetical protein
LTVARHVGRDALTAGQIPRAERGRSGEPVFEVARGRLGRFAGVPAAGGPPRGLGRPGRRPAQHQGSRPPAGERGEGASVRRGRLGRPEGPRAGPGTRRPSGRPTAQVKRPGPDGNRGSLTRCVPVSAPCRVSGTSEDSDIQFSPLVLALHALPERSAAPGAAARQYDHTGVGLSLKLVAKVGQPVKDASHLLRGATRAPLRGLIHLRLLPRARVRDDCVRP